MDNLTWRTYGDISHLDYQSYNSRHFFLVNSEISSANVPIVFFNQLRQKANLSLYLHDQALEERERERKERKPLYR